MYSRRIGETHTRAQKTKTKPPENPTTVNLVNALKVSVKKKRFRIGILNAVTEKTFAVIETTLLNRTRRQELQPLSNYSVLVKINASFKTQRYHLLILT
jgi:hypothetical protein